MSQNPERAIGRAIVEALEDRRLLSSVTLVDGVLTVAGNPDAANALAVNVTSQGTHVWGFANNMGRGVPLSQVKAVQVVGGAKADQVRVDPRLNVPVQVVSNGAALPSKPKPGTTPVVVPPPIIVPPPPAVVPPAVGSPPVSAPISGTMPDAPAPQAIITLLDTTFVAGNAVHVHALESLLNTGSAITARFDWNFGNPSGQYNNLTGFNAAHVYDNPGLYTITLRITDEAGRQSLTTTQVEIAADTRRTIYVDNNGRSSNTGQAPNQAVPLSRALQLMGDDTRLLLRRGQVYQLSSSINLPYSNVLVGAYGQGNRPVLYSVTDATSNIGMINLHDRSRDITIRDITFDSKYRPVNGKADKIPPLAIWARGTGITIRDNQFINVDNAVMANGRPTGLMVMNNTAPLETGIRAYFAWMEGTDHVYLGNQAANSTREHILRAGETGVERVLIAFNDLSNISRIGADPTDIAKGTVQLQVGSWAYVTGNTLRNGPVRVGPQGAALPNQHHRTFEWAVVENNTVNTQIEVWNGASHVMIRSNTITRPGGTAIFIVASDEGLPYRTLQDVHIVHNTALNNMQMGTFLRLLGRADGAIRMEGNRYIAPHIVPGHSGSTTAVVHIQDDGLSSFSRIANNIWPVVQAPAWARGGVFHVAKATGTGAFVTPQWWASQPVVNGDRFDNAL